MSIVHDDISAQVIKVAKEYFGLDDDLLKEENRSKPLSGFDFGFSAVAMVYFLFELEREFDIRIPAESLENYGFGTLDKVCEAIKNCLKQEPPN